MHIIWFGKRSFIPAFYADEPAAYIHEHYEDEHTRNSLLRRLERQDFDICEIDEHTGSVRLPQRVLDEIIMEREINEQHKAEFRKTFQFVVCPECGHTAPSFPRDMHVNFYVGCFEEVRHHINNTQEFLYRADMPTYCPKCGLMMQSVMRHAQRKKTRSEVWGKALKSRW